MKIKNYLFFAVNESISTYFAELTEGLKTENGIKIITNCEDPGIVIESYKPSCIIFGLNQKINEKDLYSFIRNETVFSETPAIAYTFVEPRENIPRFDSFFKLIKLPITPENFAIEIDRLVNKRRYALIVDDSQLIHKFLRQALEENNFACLEAYNAEEALAILKKTIPDIIISDVEMPGMNGFELCKKIKSDRKTENIPVIILSSLNSGIDIDRGFDAGANDYITKPIDSNELLNRINNILKDSTRLVREKILVVDDSKLIRNMIIEGFERQGFTVISAENGEDALKKAIQYEPDLITTDYDMPIMNGWEFCQALKKNETLKNIPVILLTSRDGNIDKSKTKGSGVKAYLTKPFTVDKLIAIAERAIAENRIERERELLKFYVSDAAVDLIKSGGGISKDAFSRMRAKEMFATVLFSDIESFTPTCEAMAPVDLLNLLNSYFDLMCEILKKHDAIIDKFIGDAILSIFKGSRDGALKAVMSAIEMRDSLKKFNLNKPYPLHIRIGINSGNLFFGDIGSKTHRRDFTVIGDNVNIGQRLESCAKTDGILISSSTYELISDYINAEKMGMIALKGKKKKITAYNVLSLKKNITIT